MNGMELSQIQDLIQRSREVSARSYCPYSNFPVGAALLCSDGSIFTGCNIETATFSGICAERSAFASAISAGQRRFKAIAITTRKGDQFCPPCGVCRQFMVEFEPNLLVVMGRKEPGSAHECVTLQQLLPRWFGPKNLEAK